MTRHTDEQPFSTDFWARADEIRDASYAVQKAIQSAHKTSQDIRFDREYQAFDASKRDDASPLSYIELQRYATALETTTKLDLLHDRIRDLTSELRSAIDSARATIVDSERKFAALDEAARKEAEGQ